MKCTTMRKMSLYTDDDLVKMYSCGDNRAFDELLSRTQNDVFTYILSVVQNEDRANDLFQETFVKAIIKIQNGSYDKRGRLLHWLLSIAHNVIIDNIRHEKSLSSVFSDTDCTRDDTTLALFLDTGTESDYVRSQVLKNVRMLKENLPPEQREVVEMRFYRGMSFKEIAKATNVGISTALGRMRYALRNMRRMSKCHGLLEF